MSKNEKDQLSTEALETAPSGSLAGMFGALAGFNKVPEVKEAVKVANLDKVKTHKTERPKQAIYLDPNLNDVKSITEQEIAVQTEIVTSVPVFDPYDTYSWEKHFSGKNVMEMTKKILRGAYNDDNLIPEELRFMITNYLRLQRLRIRYNNQIKSIERNYADSEVKVNPLVLTFMHDNFKELEEIVLYVMGRYVKNHPVGPWFQSIYGVGPVVSGGLLAYFDIHKAPTAGHFWSYAGLDPKVTWEKGCKRPWNAVVKMLCYYLGCCIQKCCNNENAQYGKMYLDYKDRYTNLNEQLQYAPRASSDIAKNRYTDPEVIETLKSGKLPSGHISARAKRSTVKIVISHLHHVMHWVMKNEPPPKPFAIAHLDHVHYFEVPNWDYKENKILLP